MNALDPAAGEFYPGYFFTINTDSGGSPYGFWLVDSGISNLAGATPTFSPEYGNQDPTGLVSAMYDWLIDNVDSSWGIGTVSSITVTKYTEASSNVTP